MCADLGISARKAHNLRRQLTLPEPIRERVADRPAGAQLSVTMANRLADMHDVAPRLTEAVAARITSGELHDQALRDLGALVHRTVVEDQHTYAVRIDDGALLDAADQLERARAQLTDDEVRARAAGLLGCEPDKLESELDALTARARTRALKLRITGEIRDRARAGRFAFVHDRGPDFAAGIWIVDPLFILDLVHHQLDHDDAHARARDDAFFAGARLTDDELRQAAHDENARKQQARLHQAEATRRNLGLGHDLRAGLMDPTPGQLQALKAIICHLLAAHHRDVIAYGAGWTDQQRQQPVGVTRTNTLGTDRMARKLRDALPGGHTPLRAAVWEFMRPMLSPALAAMHRDAFLTDQAIDSTVRLAEHRGDSALEDLNLDDPAAS